MDRRHPLHLHAVVRPPTGRENAHSVADPDPDPPDPHVFGPPGSGSGSFDHRAKIVRKTLIPVLFCDFF